MRHRKRLNALIKKIEAAKIDALLVTKKENIFYLTSFSSDSAALLIGPRKSFAITDSRYAEAAGNQIPRGFELIVLSDTLNTFAKAIAAVAGRRKLKKVGFESRAVTFAQYHNTKLTMGNRALVPTRDIVESLREIKDAGEIADLQKALAITKETLKELKRLLKPQLTESAVLRYIKGAFIEKGAEGTAFEPIVATQPGASQPHYQAAANRKLGNNKPILIDMGAVYGGYNSDLTRICVLGKINTKFTRLYKILLDAQRKAIDLIRPGVKISAIDDAARQYIADKGFGKFFGHSLGHGIGLEIHESPTITHRNSGVLEAGMIFTIEPGIYLPGYGGLRIEDTIQVTKEGHRVLTDDIDK
ncbi:MAG: Xaa-Pro peptidase family protein [Candidatus Omnitrophica bacterium]|nr:Xaa-Pro peptidase family protein [Candidatus Omnitrophota bacterium]